MNTKQRNMLITASVMFVICAGVNFAGWGSFILRGNRDSLSDRLLSTLIEWAAMAVIFAVYFVLLKTPRKRD